MNRAAAIRGEVELLVWSVRWAQTWEQIGIALAEREAFPLLAYAGWIP